MPAMMRGGVLVAAAVPPCIALGVTDQLLGITEMDAVVAREAFRAVRDKHHVRAVLQDGARQAHGVADALDTSYGTRAKRRAIHDDGVALDAAIEIEVRAKARVEDRIIFKDDDGGFDCVQRGAAARKNRPAGFQRAMAAGLAGVDRLIRNVPSTTVHNERRFHRKENGKAKENCPESLAKAIIMLQIKKSSAKSKTPMERR